MQWAYDDGRFAHVSSTTRSATPCTGLVVGTKGWLRLGTPFYNPRTLESRLDGQVQVEHHDPGPNPYIHEVHEVERCLRTGAVQSALVPWEDTIGILELMDDARRQLGVRYPADDEQEPAEV